jgi:hypothetical protein
MKKTKAKPWSTDELDYSKRSNWPLIAAAMFRENVTAPQNWDYTDIETRVFMEEAYGFDCALFPLLWRYLFERLPVLVMLYPAPKEQAPLQAAANGSKEVHP